MFVLDCQDRPLTPTTAAKARKLLRAGVAEKAWSKFGTFGIRLLVATRHETPQTTLGVDHGTKFEGYSVIVDQENNLNVKLDLPDKKKVLKKTRIGECCDGHAASATAAAGPAGQTTGAARTSWHRAKKSLLIPG